MPIYEYYCPDNHTVYAFFARYPALGEQTPVCPDNPDFRMERVVSGFSLRKPWDAATITPDQPDPKILEAMRRLEKEIAELDDKNVEPGQIGNLLRRISEVSGRSLDRDTEELARRLEQGEGLEKIEEELAQQIQQDDVFQEESDEALHARPLSRLFRHLPPRRDAHLYDMDDFLPPLG